MSKEQRETLIKALEEGKEIINANGERLVWLEIEEDIRLTFEGD